MDCRFHATIGHVLLSQQVAAMGVSFKGAGTGTEFIRKVVVFRVTLTRAGVDKDRARLRKRFHAGEAVVSEEYSLFAAGLDLAKTMAARGALCAGFSVGRKPVHRRQQGGANGLCDFAWNGYDTDWLHGCSSFLI